MCTLKFLQKCPGGPLCIYACMYFVYCCLLQALNDCLKSLTHPLCIACPVVVVYEPGGRFFQKQRSFKYNKLKRRDKTCF